MADTITIRDAAGNLVDVSVDDLTLLNGNVVANIHAQRFKPVFGSDAQAQDVDGTHGLPVAVLGAVTANTGLDDDFLKLTTPIAAVSYGTGTGNQAPVAPADATGRLMGYAVRETTGTAGATALVRFRSGTTAAGTPLGAGVSLVANESVREWFAPNGITVPTAVFLERVSGTTEVTVYWAAP
jgi:hypothetical protein